MRLRPTKDTVPGFVICSPLILIGLHHQGKSQSMVTLLVFVWFFIPGQLNWAENWEWEEVAFVLRSIRAEQRKLKCKLSRAASLALGDDLSWTWRGTYHKGFRRLLCMWEGKRHLSCDILGCFTVYTEHAPHLHQQCLSSRQRGEI